MTGYLKANSIRIFDCLYHGVKTLAFRRLLAARQTHRLSAGGGLVNAWDFFSRPCFIIIKI